MKILLLILVIVKVAAEEYPCQGSELVEIENEMNRELKNCWMMYYFDSMSEEEREAKKKYIVPHLYLCKHNILNKAGFDLASHIRNHLIDNFPLKIENGKYLIPFPIPEQLSYSLAASVYTELAKYGYYVTKGAIVRALNNTHSEFLFSCDLKESKEGSSCETKRNVLI